MPQCIPGRMARQWGVYRQRVAEAPALLAWETLSRSNVTQVVHEAPGKGRERCLPPSGTLWTVSAAGLEPGWLLPGRGDAGVGVPGRPRGAALCAQHGQ